LVLQGAESSSVTLTSCGMSLARGMQ
jgi:hypothetical protein